MRVCRHNSIGIGIPRFHGVLVNPAFYRAGPLSLPQQKIYANHIKIQCNFGHIRARSSVVFVGYAANGTLARQIVDGAKAVRLFQDMVPVRAGIWTINGFSAHADQPELLDWLKHCGQPQTVFLVHGELEHGMAVMRDTLADAGTHWHIPGMHETVKLA